MTDKEFMEIYGRLPRRKTKVVKKTKIYWNRIIVALLVLIGIIWGIVQLFSYIFSKPDKETSAQVKTSTVSVSQSEKKDTEYVSKYDFTVCIDVGHGYDDVGTTNQDGSRLEKDDNLAVSLLLQKELEQMGVKVVMTRTDDTNLSMADRCKIANDSKVDFTLCMHRNSYVGDESDVNGVEIWVNNCEPQEDTILAQKIMDKLDKAGITKNRGVQYGYMNIPNTNYFINADTVMPSCLIELGFLTDDKDNEMFDSKKSEYAKAIAQGTVNAAIELGIVDKNGKRLFEGEFLSKSKYINRKSSDSDNSDSNNNVSDQNYTDSNLNNTPNIQTNQTSQTEQSAQSEQTTQPPQTEQPPQVSQQEETSVGNVTENTANDTSMAEESSSSPKYAANAEEYNGID